ncbi:hypothetical protein GIB67_041990 [Kingdonia uniflora]|uniref:Mediator of RNA polymerase II transcription subunit 33A n=1 Tax=Kingdonia uniflora TaxID=39325 RepID=A0A7J7NZQ7_9MAGN|nr:hypothetical protein GIB67_041990 [Kingdonia uniflora]
MRIVGGSTSDYLRSKFDAMNLRKQEIEVAIEEKIRPKEHVLRFVVKLLSPPVPPNFTGPGSHLIDYMSMLNAIVLGMSSVDIVHILSLHGMVPEVAASLMPLCEAFGSLIPSISYKSTTSDEISVYTVFSCAFLFLLRLWKFYRPPHEHAITEGGGYTGFELTLEYLLTLRNSRIPTEASATEAVYIDSFPKLRAWYCQNKACIASTLSGICSGNPVHEVANKILKMIYWKMNKGRAMSSNLSTTSSSSISGSSISGVEETYERPILSAWEFLEAIPFVLEAVLTACAHGRLSSRDLITGKINKIDEVIKIYNKTLEKNSYLFFGYRDAKIASGAKQSIIAKRDKLHRHEGMLQKVTMAWLPGTPKGMPLTLQQQIWVVVTRDTRTQGLRDLVDFLPASLASIISYLSAEITRGIWKPVTMNGIDWPSPAANLLSIESEINEILAAVGVTVPSCSAGDAPVMLPLPVAVLVSLTITFKLDKNLEHVHSVAGPALENCAAGCPWPTMPIIGALWAQKVKRLYDFVVVTCSRSAFKQDKDAVAQLLRTCFTSFLGSPQNALTSEVRIGLCMATGVDGLLGSIISVRSPRRSIAPGFLYLRTCRTLHNAEFVNDLIVGLVSESAHESAFRLAHANKNSARLKSSQASLALAVTRAKEVATLGASLLCVTGGVQLVQLLYKETIPTWLLSTREKGKLGMSPSSSLSSILEGYSMAYLLILSGSAVWGVWEKAPTRAFCRRARIVGRHMDFIAGALEGNISLGCDPETWKAYVSCFVGLLVCFIPSWIREVKPETLRKLANGLRGWHECDLALSLLERGGIASMGSVAELIYVMD